MTKFRYVDPDELKADPFSEEKTGAGEFEALLAAENTFATQKLYRAGEAVIGSVVRVTKDYLFFDLGGKSTGSLSVEEFVENSETVPALGESVQAFVKEDNGSEVVLTRSLKRGQLDDGMLRMARENGTPVEAKVEKANSGGFEVLVNGKRGFVPMSQMSLQPISNAEEFIGQVLKFNVIEIKEGGKNIVLSRKALLKEERESLAQSILNLLQVGDQKSGIVTRLAQFGAFVDIGGVEGLVPLSELSWTRVKSVEDVLKIGDKVSVKVIKLEHSPKLRIGLSLKNASDDPWISNATKFSPGEVIEGKITRLADFGAFVSVENGVEGLIPLSQFTWEKRIAHPREVVKEGQVVSVHILTFDLEARRISLSLKGPMPENLQEKLKKKTGTSAETEEDKLLMAEWKQFKKSDAGNSIAFKAENGIFASAFANAVKRKS